MRRYYFHVKKDGHSLDDKSGEAHVTIEAAKRKALQIASELSIEPLTYRGYRVVVVDEDGKTIAGVPIGADH
jgi:hypothetical protein